MREFYYFNDVLNDIHREFKAQAKDVKVGHWQGTTLDLDKLPAFISFELFNYSFAYHVPDNIERMKLQIKPNLPWADEHFEERISRIPYNPPPSHVRWPHWQPSSESTKEVNEPDIDERDWAYLAALIDGEGSLNFHKVGKKFIQARLTIGQAEKTKEYSGGELIKKISKKFEVGKVSRITRDKLIPPSGIIQRNKTFIRWSITSPLQLKWVLEHTIPYLIMKQEKATYLLDHICNNLESSMSHPKPMNPIAKFSHTYPERFWPPRGYGIRYKYGNLDDVVNLLIRQPFTRQAYFPIFFPEDTGALSQGRLPCTLGYQFMRREDELHIFYTIRSCDLFRHFQDDVYLACRLVKWVLEELQEKDNEHWQSVVPGQLIMHIFSFHIFKGEAKKI